MDKYKIKLLAVPARNGCPPIPEAYYGPVRGVGMNFAIYCRVPEDKAYEFTKAQALHALNTHLRGWPARCEPPITVVY